MPEFAIAPHLFQVLLRERLRLPLFLTESICQGCHEPLDPLGHQSRMSPLWPHPETSHTSRESNGENLQRSWCPCQIQRFLERHERQRSHFRPEADRGARAGLAMFWRSAVGCGRDSPTPSREWTGLSPGPQKRMAQSCCKLGSTRKTSTQNSLTGDVGSWLWLWKRGPMEQ